MQSAVAGALVAGGGRALATAAYPNRPINFIVPYAAGGDFDSYVRKFCQLMQPLLKVNMEPINMPGAAGALAIFQLYRDEPDGYNISLINVPGILLSKKTGFDVTKLTWLANLGRDPLGIAVAKDSKINNVADLQALGKTRKVKMSSSGKASTDYPATQVFCGLMEIPVDIVSGYQNSVDSLVAVTRNDVDASVHSLAAIQKMQTAGLVRPIFVFEPQTPIPGVEDASAINQPDLGKIYQYRPVCAPPGLPADISKTLSDALVQSAKTPDAQAWAKKIGSALYPLDQQQTLAMVQEQQALFKAWHKFLV